MAKQPGFYLYTGDWKKDTELSMCSTSTRGIWIDLLCAMHDAGRVGKLSGTIEQLSKLGRCLPAEMSTALDELSRTQAASVTYRNNIVTVMNRRMDREAKARESTRERVRKHRQKAWPGSPKPNVTVPYMPSSISISSSDKITTTSACASSVTSAVQNAVALWNRSVPKAQQLGADGTPAIDRAYSALVLAQPPVQESEILGAIENYRLALSVPNSQAYAHSLGQFLRRENIERYLPGVFNLRNYNRKAFGRTGGAASEDPAEMLDRLKAKGELPV